MEIHFSDSEERGIKAMPTDALRIYSVGVSTAGGAEMRMARANPKRHVIASTIDVTGAAFAKEYINRQNASSQVEIKVEDVTKPLTYANSCFDYVYARLVLHYLAKADLERALSELHRTLKPGGKLFVVVRSIKCPDAVRDTSTHDDITGLTTYTTQPNPKVPARTERRFFHSEASIAQFVSAAGFTVEHVTSYDEQLFDDFKRSVSVDHTDNVVELIAVK